METMQTQTQSKEPSAKEPSAKEPSEQDVKNAIALLSKYQEKGLIPAK
jgi:hypothetical protein